MTKLRRRMSEDMQIRNLSTATQKRYIDHLSEPSWLKNPHSNLKAV